MGRRLLALHAHPDDESSKGAGAVARYADEGVRCVLVCATGGEAGDVLNPEMDRPAVLADLAAIRDRELTRAAEIIGYADVVRLGYRDSGMPDSAANSHPASFASAPFEQVLERVVAVIRRERPHVVLGYDDHVRYPHPDHLRVHDVGLAAFEAAADPQRFPDAGPPWAPAKLYASVFSIKRVFALHTAMGKLGLESPYEEWVERFDESEIVNKECTQIEVSGTLERARAALRAHATQVDPNGFWFRVPLDVVREVYPYDDFELLASRVPVSLPETDLFTNVDCS